MKHECERNLAFHAIHCVFKERATYDTSNMAIDAIAFVASISGPNLTGTVIVLAPVSYGSMVLLRFMISHYSLRDHVMVVVHVSVCAEELN